MILVNLRLLLKISTNYLNLSPVIWMRCSIAGLPITNQAITGRRLSISPFTSA